MSVLHRPATIVTPYVPFARSLNPPDRLRKAKLFKDLTVTQPLNNQLKFGMGWDSFLKRVQRDAGHAFAPDLQRERFIQFSQGRYENADAMYAAFESYEDKVIESQVHLLGGGTVGGGIGALLGYALDNLSTEEQQEQQINADQSSQSETNTHDEGPGFFTFLGGMLGAIGGAFAQHEIAEASGETYQVDEFDHAIAESIAHAGEMMSQRLATDPALQKGFELMLQLTQSGNLNEESLTYIADEYLKQAEKQVNSDGSLKFGARRDPAAKKHTLAVGIVALFSLANALAAIPGYLGHGLESPMHFVANGLMNAYLTKIYNGPSQGDCLRSNIMNGPYSLLGTGVSLTEAAFSSAMRITTTMTTPLHAGTGHVVMLPTHALLKGATSFLMGGMMIPAESSFGNALNDEEDKANSTYKRIDTHANEAINQNNRWAQLFYTGNIGESKKHHVAREKAVENIRQADSNKLTGVPKWCFEQSLLRDVDSFKRVVVTDILGSKEAIANLLTANKEQLKEHF